MDSRSKAAPEPLLYIDFQPSFKWILDEKSDTLIVNLEEFKKEQIKVQIDNYGSLKVSGQQPINDKQWRRFSNTFTTPENCEVSQIRANFEKGFLYVTLPKSVTPAELKDQPIQQDQKPLASQKDMPEQKSIPAKDDTSQKTTSRDSTGPKDQPMQQDQKPRVSQKDVPEPKPIPATKVDTPQKTTLGTSTGPKDQPMQQDQKPSASQKDMPEPKPIPAKVDTPQKTISGTSIGPKDQAMQQDQKPPTSQKDRPESKPIPPKVDTPLKISRETSTDPKDQPMQQDQKTPASQKDMPEPKRLPPKVDTPLKITSETFTGPKDQPMQQDQKPPASQKDMPEPKPIPTKVDTPLKITSGTSAGPDVATGRREDGKREVIESPSLAVDAAKGKDRMGKPKESEELVSGTKVPVREKGDAMADFKKRKPVVERKHDGRPNETKHWVDKPEVVNIAAAVMVLVGLALYLAYKMRKSKEWVSHDSIST